MRIKIEFDADTKYEKAREVLDKLTELGQELNFELKTEYSTTFTSSKFGESK